MKDGLKIIGCFLLCIAIGIFVLVIEYKWKTFLIREGMRQYDQQQEPAND